MDEYFETKKKIDKKSTELKNLTDKFKELKLLVYEYKENKEREIKRLSDEQLQLKNEIEQSKEDYEKIIDHAADQIDDFLKKASPNNLIQ
jgi:cell division protein ZapA